LLKGEEIAEKYGVNALPTLFVIGVDGKIIHAALGYDPQGLDKLVRVVENAYVADASAGLRIIDVSNPAQPVEAGFFLANDFTTAVQKRAEGAPVRFVLEQNYPNRK
jgi:thioredoxin-related protein